MRHPITYLIASRNDQFCGDSAGRLQTTVFKILEHKHYIDEVIIIDWGSLEPIETIWFHQQGLRHLYIPQEITREIPSPFCETIALNAGLRRARGHYIARLDQDTYPGLKAFAWIEKLATHSDLPPHLSPAWFSLRRDMLKGDTRPPQEIPIWNGWEPSCSGYFRGAVGCLLAPKCRWLETRGYNESLIHRNHMEHDLCVRLRNLCGLENLGVATNCDFYHQWHPRDDTRPSNAPTIPEVFDSSHRVCYSNGPDWGLNRFDLPLTGDPE